MKNSELFNDLLRNQIKNIPVDKKLKFNDLKRLCKYISSSIFDENVCCLWNGYITNINNIEKGIYINFYFKGKKVALHRLLYINFVGELHTDEYLKFTCENKGKCCNIHHLKKFKYVKKKKNTKRNIKEINKISETDEINKNIGTIETNTKSKITNESNSDSFILSFD